MDKMSHALVVNLDIVPCVRRTGRDLSRGLGSNPVLQEHLSGKREGIMHLRTTIIAC
jgi:hypothetical protein